MGLRVSILINIIFAVFCAWYFGMHVGFDVYYQKYITPKETFFDDIYYKAKVAAYIELNRQIDNDKKYIVFVGDSLVEQWPVHEFFTGQNIINRGIGFDTTVGVLNRLESNLNNINIAKLFLMIGHNDLKYRSVDETIENIKTVLSEVKADKKYFMSVLPSAAHNNKAVKQLNARIQQFCHSNKIGYINLYPLFFDEDGSISAQLYYDGVHLNVKGYLKLSELINQFIPQISS